MDNSKLHNLLSDSANFSRYVESSHQHPHQLPDADVDETQEGKTSSWGLGLEKLVEAPAENPDSLALLANTDEEQITPDTIATIQKTLSSLFSRGGTEKPKKKRAKRIVRIPGLDEDIQELLTKYQEQLEELNADIDTDQIRQAILDNPQHLENAILAFIEASSKRKLEPKLATGYLYKAVINGWKPRRRTVVDSSTYVLPSELKKTPKQPTLVEIVESKRLIWQNAKFLRPAIEEWVQKTEGVYLSEDGPELEF